MRHSALLVLVFAVCRVASGQVDFDAAVRPILERCTDCHAYGVKKGGFSIETRKGLLQHVIPGDPAASRLIEVVSGADPDFVMPPKGEPLTPEEVGMLQAWIDAGAAWPDGFSFDEGWTPPLRPRRPQLPPAIEGATNPIDRLLEPYFAARGIEPAPIVDDRTFARRVHLDLVGLLPAVDALEAFVASGDPDKRRVLVRQLLDDRVAYAEHWLTFWNDHLRNDYDGTGYIDGGRRQITDWLLRALHDGMPFDQFVRELVNPPQEASGFANGITWRGEFNSAQSPAMQYAQNVAQVFLGENLKCASCHDSFIDGWTLDAAYGVAAIWSAEPMELHRCDTPTGALATAQFPFPELGDVDPDAPRDERLEQFAELLTMQENGRTTRTIVNRLWARLLGRGLVEPLDSMSNEPWSADVLDHLAVELAEGGYDLQSTLEMIATSDAYQRAVVDVDPDEPFVFRGPSPRRMTAEQFVDAIWMVTGAGPAQRRAASIGADGSFVRVSVVNADLLTRGLGRPNREQVVTDRPDELTTLQALDLTNGPGYARLVRRGAPLLAERIEASSRDAADEIFLAFLSRPPTEEERAIVDEMLGSASGLEDLLWVVTMLPEFQVIP